MNSKLLDIIEETLRERFGDITTQRSVDDTTGEVKIAVYRDAPSFARNITLSKELVEQYEKGILAA